MVDNLSKTDLSKFIAIAGQILAYIIAIILIIQILKLLIGGSWAIEDIILGLIILNLTITFGIGSYLINLSNKISDVNTKVEGHIKWHKGVNNGLKKEFKNKKLI